MVTLPHVFSTIEAMKPYTDEMASDNTPIIGMCPGFPNFTVLKDNWESVTLVGQQNAMSG